MYDTSGSQIHIIRWAAGDLPVEGLLIVQFETYSFDCYRQTSQRC